VKDAVDMGGDAMVYVPRFMKICSAFQKLTEVGVYADTQIA
jgi:hypothetical protein